MGAHSDLPSLFPCSNTLRSRSIFLNLICFVVRCSSLSPSTFSTSSTIPHPLLPQLHLTERRFPLPLSRNASTTCCKKQQLRAVSNLNSTFLIMSTGFAHFTISLSLEICSLATRIHFSKPYLAVCPSTCCNLFQRLLGGSVYQLRQLDLWFLHLFTFSSTFCGKQRGHLISIPSSSYGGHTFHWLAKAGQETVLQLCHPRSK
jgi:hypothetical protein